MDRDSGAAWHSVDTSEALGLKIVSPRTSSVTSVERESRHAVRCGGCIRAGNIIYDKASAWAQADDEERSCGGG